MTSTKPAPLTEHYRCPLSGDDPGTAWRYARCPASPNACLMPGRILPADMTDAMAEHERAMWRAESWSRAPDGRVFLWVER